MSETIISSEVADRVLGEATRKGASFAEVFVEDAVTFGASLDDGRVEDLSSGRRRGAGIRVLAGNQVGFAHTADLSEAGLLRAAQAASEAARNNNESSSPTKVSLPGQAEQHAMVPRVPHDEKDKAEKVALLMEANEHARSVASSITQVSVGYGQGVRNILVANTDGVFASDSMTRTRFSVSCVASGDTGQQTGYEAVGATQGLELFDTHAVDRVAYLAARRAVTKLSARPAPSGPVTVVIGSGGGGVLFHEACGHGLEADLVNKGASVFAGRVGERVAAPGITVVDNGTMVGEWGHYHIDDEGNPAQTNTLISDGELTGYMWDLIRSRQYGGTQSGNGRRETYEHLPMVRMTNTYLLAGDIDPDDIIADTPNGIYIKHLGGGQVNTATGDFVFGMTEAYMIENGRVTFPLREGNLIGNGPQVLKNIDAIGNDFAMGPPGTCGKDGQGVPVGDGIPTLRVTELTVGGTAA